MSTHIVWSWGCWDTWIQEIKAMSKVLKIFYRFQGFKCYVCWRRRRWCLWLLRKCIQTHSVLYTCPSPLQEGLLLRSPPSCGFSGSPPCSPRRQLCFKMFWDLSNYKGDCRQDAQPIPNSWMLWGAQQPSNSYKFMTKLLPPHCNRTCHKYRI